LSGDDGLCRSASRMAGFSDFPRYKRVIATGPEILICLFQRTPIRFKWGSERYRRLSSGLSNAAGSFHNDEIK
jgi:hypothetical protein